MKPRTARSFASCLAYSATLLFAMPSAGAASIGTVPVGNPGNAGLRTFSGTYGAVPNAYRIGTYEVTNAQYAEFLNAKAAGDFFNLYSDSMGTDPRGGITRSGSFWSFTYAVKPGMGDKPVNYVSWYDAIRFANWLNNGGLPTSDTETGAYTILGGTPTPSNDLSITRNAGAKWFLPSQNEWFKAAYYDPRTAAEGGPSGNIHYWGYPTMSYTPPTMATATAAGAIGNPGPNVANSENGADWNGQDGNVTTVGSAGPLSASFYGTFDQGGNVDEWNESLVNISGLYHGLRGGSWRDPTSYLAVGTYGGADGPLETNDIGFRVATVPEPSTLALSCAGWLIAVVAVRARRSCRPGHHASSATSPCAPGACRDTRPG